MAVPDFSQGSRVLSGHPGGRGALLGETGVVYDPSLGDDRFDGTAREPAADRLHRPGGGGRELLELLVIDAEALCHGLDRLAAPVKHQAPQIQGALGPLIRAGKRGKDLAYETYIHTWQGFIYLATVIDCYSKKVVGWAIEDHMRSELVERALSNAADTTRIEPDASWHSDRGSV